MNATLGKTFVSYTQCCIPSAISITVFADNLKDSMHFQEIILCSTSPSSSSSGPGSITLHDIQTGSSLASFKQTSARTNSTAVVHTQNGQGGFVLSAQPEKSIMNVYNFQKVGRCSQTQTLLTRLNNDDVTHLGPTSTQDCATRKTLMYCCRPQRSILCWRNIARSRVFMGGTYVRGTSV